MFISAELFFAQLLHTKMLWIRGGLGSGKTLLAFAIAEYFLKTGDYVGVVANIPHVYPFPVDGSLQGCVIVLDEAHEFVDSRSFQTNEKHYGAYARKSNSLWLFPSVYPVDVRLRSMFCERTLKIGNLLWWYKGGFELSYINTQFGFGLWRPSRYFGKYDTRAIPYNDGGVSFLWRRTMAEIKAQTEGELSVMLEAMGVPKNELFTK